MRCATSGIWSTAALIMTMAVITPRTYRWVTLAGVDLLEGGDQGEPFRLRPVLARIPPPVVGLASALVLAAGLVVADGLRSDATRPSSTVQVRGPGAPTDLGARSAGGTAERSGAGSAGTARLEIRNGGQPVQLLSVSAHVPGVLFVSRLIDGGLTLGPDGLALVALRFSVPDCARLEESGELVLRVERYGAVQELRLPVRARLTGRAGPEVDLRVVLDSCG